MTKERFLRSAGELAARCFVGLICFAAARSLAGMAFPTTDAIGQRADRLQNWLYSPTNAIYPTYVQLDLEDGRVVGIVCEYAETPTRYTSAKKQLQSLLNVAPRVSGDVTTAWRIETKKCAVMLTLDDEKKVLRVIVRGFGDAKQQR